NPIFLLGVVEECADVAGPTGDRPGDPRAPVALVHRIPPATGPAPLAGARVVTPRGGRAVMHGTQATAPHPGQGVAELSRSRLTCLWRIKRSVLGRSNIPAQYAVSRQGSWGSAAQSGGGRE